AACGAGAPMGTFRPRYLPFAGTKQWTLSYAADQTGVSTEDLAIGPCQTATVWGSEMSRKEAAAAVDPAKTLSTALRTARLSWRTYYPAARRRHLPGRGDGPCRRHSVGGR